MQKLNILVVFRDHFSTLRNDKTGNLSLVDVAVFYGGPAFLSVVYFLKPFNLPDDLTSPLIAVFSIFSALLFSAQIALYSLAPSPPRKVEDAIQNRKREIKYQRQKQFFKDVNFNTSYLICISCVALLLFLVLEVFDVSSRLEGAALILVVTHFFLSLLMLVRRTHVAFSIGHELRD